MHISDNRLELVLKSLNRPRNIFDIWIHNLLKNCDPLQSVSRILDANQVNSLAVLLLEQFLMLSRNINMKQRPAISSTHLLQSCLSVSADIEPPHLTANKLKHLA